MDNHQRKFLTSLYQTPVGAWQPHWAQLSRGLNRLSSRWRNETQHYEQPPAPLVEFVNSPLYLGLEGHVYPQVLRAVKEIFEGDYTEAVLSWGIGAGKSFLSSLAMTYMVHCALCLRDPQAYYGLAPATTIAFMNMAPSALQAQRIVFTEICNRIQKSPWFQSDFAKVQVLRSELRFPKNIVVVPGCSAETFPLGYNLLGAVVDEAAWLIETTDGHRDYAEEIYNALQRRIRSRFLDRGLLILISSPRHTDDFMERKLREAETNPQIYASRKAVWDAKPPGTYSGETFRFQDLDVPVEYERDFKRNPQRALRDLAARPTDALEAFFSDPEAIEAACDPQMQCPLDETGRWADWFRAPDNLPRYVHIDLGITRDACGIAMAYCQSSTEDPDEPEAIVELAWRLQAPESGEVNLSRVLHKCVIL